LLATAVDALGDVDRANAGEVQLLDDAKRIREFATDPTCVIGQDDIEGPRFFASCREKFFQPGSLVGRSRDGLVRIDVFVRKSSTDEMRVYREQSANPEALIPVCPPLERKFPVLQSQHQ